MRILRWQTIMGLRSRRRWNASTGFLRLSNRCLRYAYSRSRRDGAKSTNFKWFGATSPALSICNLLGWKWFCFQSLICPKSWFSHSGIRAPITTWSVVHKYFQVTAATSMSFWKTSTKSIFNLNWKRRTPATSFCIQIRARIQRRSRLLLLKRGCLIKSLKKRCIHPYVSIGILYSKIK